MYSIEEIYLFYLAEDTISNFSLYQSLTGMNYTTQKYSNMINQRITKPNLLYKKRITKGILNNFLINIIRDKNGKPFELSKSENDFENEKDSYQKIIELKLNNQTFWIARTLGQKSLFIKNENPYIVNPFEAGKGSFEKTISSSLLTLNSNLLLDSGKIVQNNIYLCFAKDVLSEFPSFQEEIIQLYYPFLYLKNIISFDQLESSEELLKESSKKILNENILRNFENIDLFFDIYKNKKTNLNYKISGVQYIKTVIHPEYEIKIPLEVIFKILHATERNPLIKYNASSRQENVYRLYTDKISTDGRKIPFLSKSTILKLIKTI